MATVAITGILMAGTIVALNRVRQNSRIDICESELRDMTAALKSYFSDYGNIIAEPDATAATDSGLVFYKNKTSKAELTVILPEEKIYKVRVKVK